jgi:hypothetical protein
VRDTVDEIVRRPMAALTGASAAVARTSWHPDEKRFLQLKARFPSAPRSADPHRTGDAGAGGIDGVPAVAHQTTGTRP